MVIKCFECNGSKKISFSKIKEDFENEGYKVLNDETLFISQVKTKIEFICPNEHKHSMSYRKFKYGQRCSRCSVSKEEREVKKELTDLGFKFIENDRKTILNPNTNHYLELDIYFPERKIAIEYNGSYWHNLEERRNNDNIKKEVCEKLGIELITIEESDWKLNKDTTIKSIMDLLNS